MNATEVCPPPTAEEIAATRDYDMDKHGRYYDRVEAEQDAEDAQDAYFRNAVGK